MCDVFDSETDVLKRRSFLLFKLRSGTYCNIIEELAVLAIQ